MNSVISFWSLSENSIPNIALHDIASTHIEQASLKNENK